MTEELEKNEEHVQAFNVFKGQYITASETTPNMEMMSIDEIGEWILGTTGRELSNYDLNSWLKEAGYSHKTVSNTIMWMVSPVGS